VPGAAGSWAATPAAAAGSSPGADAAHPRQHRLQQTLRRAEGAAGFSSLFCQLRRHFCVCSENGTRAGTTLLLATGAGECQAAERPGWASGSSTSLAGTREAGRSGVRGSSGGEV